MHEVSNRFSISAASLAREARVRVFHALLKYAVARGERFNIRFDASKYRAENTLDEFKSLGRVTEHRRSPRRRSLLRRIFRSFLFSRERVIEVEGSLSERFASVLIAAEPPEHNQLGDEAPVEEISIFAGGKRIFFLYEYGARQLVTVEHIEELIEALADEGFSAQPGPQAPDGVTELLIAELRSKQSRP